MRSVIHERMKEIRNFVNISWKNYILRQDKARFFQLISALDTIEDAEEAILAFESIEVGESPSAMYLITYGLLQALFIQQDATENLSEALEIDNKLSKYSQLTQIREIRNDSIGHPTKRDRRGKGQPISYHQISRPTMSKQGFQLLSYYNDGSRKHTNISIPMLIADQKKFITEILTLVISKLRAEVKAHKEKFQMEKLTAIFPETLSYSFEKIYESFHSGPVELGHWGLNQTTSTIQAFHEAVKRRNMEAYTKLQNDFIYTDRAIKQLERMLNDRATHTSQPDDEIDGYIYLSFLRNQMDNLQGYAKEIDDEYETE